MVGKRIAEGQIRWFILFTSFCYPFAIILLRTFERKIFFCNSVTICRSMINKMIMNNRILKSNYLLIFFSFMKICPSAILLPSVWYLFVIFLRPQSLCYPFAISLVFVAVRWYPIALPSFFYPFAIRSGVFHLRIMKQSSRISSKKAFWWLHKELR